MKFVQAGRASGPIAALVAFGLLLGLSPLAAQEGPAPRRQTLTVTGEGHATGVPDMATFSTGVVSEAKVAREALDANSKAVADLIAAVKGTGVEARDISTSGFSVQPQYAEPKKDSNDGPRIVGYQVRNTVSVRVRDLARLGGLLDQVVTSGANQIGGIAFDIADPSKLEDAARVAAVEDARHQAELIANASRVRLVRVLTVVAGSAPRPMPRMMAAAPMRLKAADAVPVEAGESEVTADVTITYEIEPR